MFSGRLLKNLDFKAGAKTTRLSGLMVVACYCRVLRSMVELASSLSKKPSQVSMTCAKQSLTGDRRPALQR